VINDADIERILAELDSRGLLVTSRGEVEASAVAMLTGESLRTLRHWRSIGFGPMSSRTIGTVALYPLEEVLEWLTTQRRAHGDELRNDPAHERNTRSNNPAPAAQSH